MVKDQLKLHLIVFIWGFTSILGKEISLPAVEVVFYRTLIASLALLVLLVVLGRKIILKPRAIIYFVAVGMLVGAHWITFFASARISKISICLAGMATTSLFTALLEPIINRTKVKWYELVLGFVVILGLYTIFQFELEHINGLLLALLSACLGAVFTIINARFTKVYAPLTITFYEMIGACLFTVIFFPIYIKYFTSTGSLDLSMEGLDFIYMLLLAIICTVYAFYASIEIMKRISAYNVNLTTNLEPVYGIILAFFIYGEAEKMSDGFYAGTLIILSSVMIYPYLDKKIGKWERAKAARKDANKKAA
ncbi:MAG: EamA family transporter [Thalassobius sp.]|nr:EamA family transporter [Thalassovita sp.]